MAWTHVTLLVALSVLFLLGIFINNRKPEPTKIYYYSNQNATTVKPTNPSINTCKPKKFVFLKVHKSGSTFLAGFLQKFSKKHSFRRSESLNYGTWIGGFPGPFNSDFYKPDHGKVDAISRHMVWNWEGIKPMLSKPVDHKTIAIVRNPMDNFRNLTSEFVTQVHSSFSLNLYSTFNKILRFLLTRHYHFTHF